MGFSPNRLAPLLTLWEIVSTASCLVETVTCSKCSSAQLGSPRISCSKKDDFVNVLVAIDDSAAARKSVSFAARLVSGAKPGNDRITLLHVVECLPDYITRRSSSGGSYEAVAREWADANRKGGENLLASYRDELVAAGIPAERIQTKCLQKDSLPEAARVVAAMAIIQEMKQGNYDTVVIGRRGTSARVESFLGGVAEKVAREAHGRTLCIVDD
jgi:nucleotide-binding universal stress UspA family protein